MSLALATTNGNSSQQPLHSFCSTTLTCFLGIVIIFCMALKNDKTDVHFSVLKILRTNGLVNFIYYKKKVIDTDMEAKDIFFF